MWPCEQMCFLFSFTVGFVGLRWSHPVRRFSFYQIREHGLLSYRIFICTLLFSCRKTASISSLHLFLHLFFCLVRLSNYRKLFEVLTSSFYPLWNLLWNLFFLPQQDRNSDAITAVVHVSTGRHKLPGTVSSTECECIQEKKHAGNNLWRGLVSIQIQASLLVTVALSRRWFHGRILQE